MLIQIQVVGRSAGSIVVTKTGESHYLAMRAVYNHMHANSSVVGRFVSSDAFLKLLTLDLGYEVRIKRVE